MEKKFRQFDDSSASRRLLPRLGQLALVAESLRQARGRLRAARAASAVISSAAFVTQGRDFDSSRRISVAVSVSSVVPPAEAGSGIRKQLALLTPSR